MFRYSKIFVQRPSLLSPISSIACESTLSFNNTPSGIALNHETSNKNFHTFTLLLDGKKDAYKKRLMIANLLKKKQKEKTKKQKKAKSSAGKKKSKGEIKQVTPQMKTTGKEGSPAPKDIVYDGTPRVKRDWNKKKGSLPFEQNKNIIFSSPKEKGQFIKYLQSFRSIDTNNLKFDSKGNPILVPILNIDGLYDLSAFVTNFYKQIESETKRLNEIAKKSSNFDNEESGRNLLKDLDLHIQSIHNFSSILNALKTFYTKEKTLSELEKYKEEFPEVIPQIISDNGDQLHQALKQLENIFSSSPVELKVIENLKYWLKRFGASIGKVGYNQFSTAFKAMSKHFSETEKRAENIVFVSMPVAYEHQLPKNIRAQIVKMRTKYLGLDSYKIGSTSFVLPVLKYIRDPIVRREVFNQAREAFDGEKSKFLPSLQQSSQLANKVATTLGFQNVVEMEMTEKYGLSIETVKSTLLSLGKDAYNEQYINGLVKSKKKENNVWKYNDKEKETIPDYDKLHAEFVHFEEVMGVFPPHQLKSFLPLYSILFSYFKLLENSFGIIIKNELALAGELWDDASVKKFVIYDKETEKPISNLYLDLFPRENKPTDEKFTSISISKVDNGIPRVIIRGNTENRLVQPTLSHKQLSELYRALGEMCYDAIIVPKLPYQSLSNPLERKALGSYFARLVHNSEFLNSISEHFYNSRNIPQGYLEDMLIQNPVVRPFEFVEKTAKALLDIELFSNSKPNTKTIFTELEQTLGKGKIQPNMNIANSIDVCGTEFVEQYAELLGSELFAKYPTSFSNGLNENLKSLLLEGQLKYVDDFSAIKSELSEVAFFDERNERQNSKYANTEKPADTFYSRSEQI